MRVLSIIVLLIANFSYLNGIPFKRQAVSGNGLTGIDSLPVTQISKEPAPEIIAPLLPVASEISKPILAIAPEAKPAEETASASDETTIAPSRNATNSNETVVEDNKNDSDDSITSEAPIEKNSTSASDSATIVPLENTIQPEEPQTTEASVPQQSTESPLEPLISIVKRSAKKM